MCMCKFGYFCYVFKIIDGSSFVVVLNIGKSYGRLKKVKRINIVVVVVVIVIVVVYV